MEAGRQDVTEEAPDELACFETHGLPAVLVLSAVILVTEGDGIRVGADEAAVSDCDPMCVSREVSQYRFWSGERFLGVDDPVDGAEGIEKGVERGFVGERSVIAEEVQQALIVGLGELFQKEASE